MSEEGAGSGAWAAGWSCKIGGQRGGRGRGGESAQSRSAGTPQGKRGVSLAAWIGRLLQLNKERVHAIHVYVGLPSWWSRPRFFTHLAILTEKCSILCRCADHA